MSTATAFHINGKKRNIAAQHTFAFGTLYLMDGERYSKVTEQLVFYAKSPAILCGMLFVIVCKPSQLEQAERCRERIRKDIKLLQATGRLQQFTDDALLIDITVYDRPGDLIMGYYREDFENLPPELRRYAEANTLFGHNPQSNPSPDFTRLLDEVFG